MKKRHRPDVRFALLRFCSTNIRGSNTLDRLGAASAFLSWNARADGPTRPIWVKSRTSREVADIRDILSAHRSGLATQSSKETNRTVVTGRGDVFAYPSNFSTNDHVQSFKQGASPLRTIIHVVAATAFLGIFPVINQPAAQDDTRQIVAEDSSRPDLPPRNRNRQRRGHGIRLQPRRPPALRLEQCSWG